MKRRDTFKYLLISTIGGATIGTNVSCDRAGNALPDTPKTKGYGRTPEELKYDEEVMAEEFLNEHELATIAVLCDIILPATSTAGSATAAKVPEFIDFIVKDLPVHQLPMRGGLMWLNSESYKRFGKVFIECSPEEELQVIEDIAYPDPDDERPAMAYGIEFFNLMRNLTLTGYYTTKMGFKDLEVNSNYANVWDGVPDAILAEHDVEYDPEWIAKCVDQSKRDVIAEWNKDGDLLT